MITNGQRKEFTESHRVADISKEGKKAYEVRSKRETIEDEMALSKLLKDFH
tara:strand:- start:1066 stop:1218 length:153 start_codon:yes stop_codon:yes gene_type:complete